MNWDYKTVESMPLIEILENKEKIGTNVLSKLIIDAGAVNMRDVDNGETPYNYSSGNWGPVYAMVKGLVSSPHVLNLLCNQLALKLVDKGKNFDFISANVTGGVVPGAYLRNAYEVLTGKNCPLVYVRDTRVKAGEVTGKVGGLFENITGIETGHRISKGDKGVVIEELINFADTTCNAATEVLRPAGYVVTDCACIFTYLNPNAIKQLAASGLDCTYVVTMPETIDGAEATGAYKKHVIDSVRESRANPLDWQRKRGLEPIDPKVSDKKEKKRLIEETIANWKACNKF